MAAVVSLRDFINEMETMADEFHAFLNKNSGELVTITDEDIHAIENGDDLTDYPDWQQENLATAKKVLHSADYLPLPSKFDINEYGIMERFCYSIEDLDLSEEMADQIRGSGAFRRFKNALYRHNIEDEWYKFRAQELEEIAIDWLDSHEIAYKKSDAAGEEE